MGNVTNLQLAAQMVQWADSQARVKGTYCGESFTGTAIKSRQLSWPSDYPEELTVKLDTPRYVHLLGRTIDVILINSRDAAQGRDGMSISRI